MDQPHGRLRIGLIGAGPWANRMHAPAIAAHPGVDLVSVWARRPEAAADLVATHGGEVAPDPDALIDRVDAVAFAVPPGVQSGIAVRAARAGRALILDKPIGASLAEAQRVADAAAAVPSLVLLTRRYAPEIDDWLTGVAATDGWLTGDARWYGSALLSGPFSQSPWRQERGGLLDVGPHTLDLLDAALGPIEDVLAAHRSEPDVTHLVLAHEGGRTSTASLCQRMPVDPQVVEVSVYGSAGRSTLPPVVSRDVDCYAALLDDLLGMIAAGRTEHPLDARRGLHLQRIIDHAERLLGV